jgi:hypothetical protein
MPSRKTFFIIFVLIIVIGGLTWWFRVKTQTTVYENPQAKLVTAMDKMIVTDTDNDKLMDWEEELWKTDPKNPDTDGDTMNDGEEIHQERDPLKKGPDDKLDKDTIQNKINPESEADLTETDKFSRELFVKYLAAKQSGQPLDENDYRDLLTRAVEQPSIQKIYTEKDFITFSSETTEKVKAYGNEIAHILTDPAKQPLEHELAILGRVTENQDATELEKLKPLITQYELIRNSLLQTKVPLSAVPWHIRLINIVQRKIVEIQGMAFIFSDPLRAFPTINQYMEDENANEYINSIKSFQDYFALQNITFEQNDRAYLLTNSI